MSITRRALIAAMGSASLPIQAAEYPDVRSVAPDLNTPEVTNEAAAAGRRVRQSTPDYEGTSVYHALYLPPGWSSSRRYPVIVEYAGNGGYRNQFGDVSEGTVEGSNLGYGISGGTGFIWLCLPYVNVATKHNQTLWWGDAEATAAYAKQAVKLICDHYAGDPQRIVLAGFSRGAIACNYIGLRDDSIAKLWRAFIPYSHYDGVRESWPYGDADRASALKRLSRLNGRPQFIIHENSVEDTQKYLNASGIEAPYTFRTLEFRNHNDAWTLRDIPERREVREWLKRVLL